jgi:hypothetical protein
MKRFLCNWAKIPEMPVMICESSDGANGRREEGWTANGDRGDVTRSFYRESGTVAIEEGSGPLGRGRVAAGGIAAVCAFRLENALRFSELSRKLLHNRITQARRNLHFQKRNLPGE